MAKAKEKKELSLESILWNCRVALRGIGSMEKNRDAVLGLVFLKFAGDKFTKRRKEIEVEHGNIPAFLDKPAFYAAKSVFYLPENCRWEHIVHNASESGIAVIIDKAMNDITEKNPALQGALPQGFYTGCGASQRALKCLIDEINKIDEKKFHDEDLIGRVYEYFLQAFAVAATKEEGEFYTPASIVGLIAELIEPFDGKVYDPCCGSGGMFVQSMKFVEQHHGNRLKVSVYGQEKNPITRRLAKLNLAIRGISHNFGDFDASREASTFQEDCHPELQADFIMANPPFNLKDWRGEDELTKDSRWLGYKIPPKSNANYAWILHMIKRLDVNNGIAGFLLANGALNADGDEGEIRKQIIENDKVEAIIVLPRDMFYTTDISVTLWIINNNKKARTLNGRNLRDRRGEVLFIDLRPWDKNMAEYQLEKGTKKKVVLTDKQIAEIKKIYNNWQTGEGYSDVAELCKLATQEEIKKQKYSLAPSKYIEFIDHDLEIDYEKEMKRIQSEMKDILAKEKESQNMLESAFKGIGFPVGGVNGQS